MPTGSALETETLGTKQFTVTASDKAGNTTTLTHTYTVGDTISPRVEITTPTAGQVIQRGQSVQAQYECIDDLGGSGVATCEGSVPNGSAIDTATPGEKTLTVTAVDVAGNRTTVTRTYRVEGPADITPPSVTITRPADGEQIPRGDTVAADYACTDEQGGSGIASCTGTTPSGEPIDTQTLGPKTFAVTGTDAAGNTRTVTHTYIVIDNVTPQASITTPANNQTVTQGQSVIASYSCTDEAGGSGIASCNGPVANGAPIDTATQGSKTFTVVATDNAGNTNSIVHAYTVVPPAPAISTTSGQCQTNDRVGTLNLLLADGTVSLTGGSSNTAVVPNSGIAISGTGTNRTLRITGSASGVAIVTVSAPGNPAVAPLAATVRIGTTGNDALTGTSGTDMLFGRSGNDALVGLSGSDLICGGGDNDNLDGGDGNDTLDGGVGNDTARGGEGDDSIAGGDGNDNLSGGTGNDTLAGNAGNDTINGEAGRDLVDGGNGSDTLRGGSDADLFRGGAGIDVALDLSPFEGDTQDGTIP